MLKRLRLSKGINGAPTLLYTQKNKTKKNLIKDGLWVYITTIFLLLLIIAGICFFSFCICIWFPVSVPVWHCDESFYCSVWPFPSTECSGIVWCVNWPLCQGQFTGTDMLVQCRTYLDMEKKKKDRRGSAKRPRGSQGRWGHSCLISRLNRGQQLRE